MWMRLEMSKVYDFIKGCGPFFVLTVNENSPAGRPFGAIMEIENKLYISTADTKAVYKQLKENNNMQILALKPGTREWVRVTGIATECESKEIKERMLVECPILTKHYPTADAPHYNIFEVSVVDCEFN